MTNQEFQKIIELSEDNLIMYDNVEIWEFDTENETVYYDSEDLPISEVDIDYVKVFSIEEVEFPDDLAEYIKFVKASINSIHKEGKSLKAIKLGEDYILSPEYLEEFTEMGFFLENIDNMEFHILKSLKV